MIIVSLFSLYKKTLSHVTEEWLTKITQLIKGSVGTQDFWSFIFENLLK